jgi:hypothetical protein
MQQQQQLSHVWNGTWIDMQIWPHKRQSARRKAKILHRHEFMQAFYDCRAASRRLLPEGKTEQTDAFSQTPICSLIKLLYATCDGF